MNIKLIIFISSLTFCGVCCDNDEETRKLTYEKNPDCSNQLNVTDCEKFILVHVIAESETNSLHYLFDLIGKPSVLIAKTPKNTSLNIDWTRINGNFHCINFTSSPDYVFATVINNFVLFNDTKGTSNYSDPSNTNVVKFNPLDFNWKQMNLTNLDGEKMLLEVNGTNHNNNGSFSLKFTAYGFKNHDENLPKLLHTENSMQIDIIADKVISNYSSPRIAIELLMISSEDHSEGSFYKMNRIRNLDDEFTPGIFDVYNILTPRSDNNTKGGFIQFRPVCYTSHYRSVSSSTESRHGNVESVDLENFKYSLPYNFFDVENLTNSMKQAINITFGMPDDGFYSHTNYVAFSLLMGLGAPASEGLSMFVKIFSSVGLGVPLLVLLVGGIYVAVKRYRN